MKRYALALALLWPALALAQAPKPPGAATRPQGAAAAADVNAQGGAAVAGAANPGAAVAGKGGAAKLLDLNTASLADISAIPGLGDAAQKIVDGRPWSNKAQLVARKVISSATFLEVRNLVVARKPAK